MQKIELYIEQYGIEFTQVQLTSFILYKHQIYSLALVWRGSIKYTSNAMIIMIPLRFI